MMTGEIFSNKAVKSSVPRTADDNLLSIQFRVELRNVVKGEKVIDREVKSCCR